MAFAYYIPLTIDHTQCGSANSSNFPVLVSVTLTPHKASNANGYDVYFYSDSGLTTRLAAERESYNNSTGAWLGWVKIPTLSVSSDTVFYVAYNDSGIASDPNSDATYGTTSTWDTGIFNGVWHLPDGTSLTANDSTSNARNGTATNMNATTGKVNGGAINTATTSRITASSAAVTLNTGMFEWWAYPSFSVGSTPFTIWDTDSTRHTVYSNTPLGGILALYFDGYESDFVCTWTTSAWNHLVVCYNKTGNVLRLWVNGTEISSSGTTGTWGSTALGANVYFGNRFSVDECGTGVDEVRIYSAIQSDSWITASYNAQANPTSFCAAGTEVAVGALSLSATDSLTIGSMFT